MVVLQVEYKGGKLSEQTLDFGKFLYPPSAESFSLQDDGSIKILLTRTYVITVHPAMQAELQVFDPIRGVIYHDKKQVSDRLTLQEGYKVLLRASKNVGNATTVLTIIGE